MKKIIALFMVLVFSLSLCACGNTLEKMEKDAISIEFESLFQEYSDNAAAAEIKYKDQPLKFTATVATIDSFRFEFWVDTTIRSGFITVKMDKKDLANLIKGKTYTFVAYYDGDLFYDAVVIE